MSFDEIKCQDRAIGLLRKALAAERVAHAWIFAGKDGVGREKTAFEFGKTLLCANPVYKSDAPESCGICESCRLCGAGSHPDLNLIYKELREYTENGKGKAPPVEVPIDVIREFLIDKAYTSPVAAERKIFVVKEAEKLNHFSQNALLKVLEEPPEFCTIILLCTRLEQLLPTTRSRCQIVNFGPVSEEYIRARLTESGSVSGEAGTYLSRFAEGSLGEALHLAGLEKAGAEVYELKKRLIKQLVRADYSDALSFAGQLVEEVKKVSGIWCDMEESASKKDIARRTRKLIIRVFMTVLRDLMRLSVSDEGNLVNSDQINEMRSLASRWDQDIVAAHVGIVAESFSWVDSSVNEKLIFERLLLKLTDSGTMQV